MEQQNHSESAGAQFKGAENRVNRAMAMVHEFLTMIDESGIGNTSAALSELANVYVDMCENGVERDRAKFLLMTKTKEAFTKGDSLKETN